MAEEQEANTRAADMGSEAVVLAHGLGRTARSLARLERHLNQAGYITHNWAYVSRDKTFAELVDDFQIYLESLPETRMPVHFVGHSLGGLLIRGVLTRGKPFDVGRVVMIATPNQGVALVDRLGKTGLPELLFGPSANDLGPKAATFRSLGVPHAEIGIIAGTRQFHPLNPSSWLNSILQTEIAHDGTVEVASTRLPVMADYLEVPLNHTFLHMHSSVIEQVIHFIRTGKFDHDANTQGAADRMIAAWTEWVSTVRESRRR